MSGEKYKNQETPGKIRRFGNPGADTGRCFSLEYNSSLIMYDLSYSYSNSCDFVKIMKKV